jgi:IS30 family transposase
MAQGISDSKKLTLDQLKAFRAEIDQVYVEGMNTVQKEFQRGTLTQNKYDDAESEFQQLKLQSRKLLGLIMSGKLDALLDTDVDSPASEIGIATNKLRKAAQKLENFLEFLQSIAEVIRIATGLIVAIQTGSIAKIA